MSVFGEVKNIEEKTNDTFKFCGRYPTIMSGTVYRYRKTQDNRIDEEISSSREYVAVDVSIRSKQQLEDTIETLRRAFSDYEILTRGLQIEPECYE